MRVELVHPRSSSRLLTQSSRASAMKIVLFCHSIRSDWNNGNAHFHRGVVAELVRRGHSLRVFEPNDAWAVSNLAAEMGQAGLEAFRPLYPELDIQGYDPSAMDLDEALDGANLVIVHGWTPREVCARLGEHRASDRRYRLLFHDTHHRSLTGPDERGSWDLSRYDGILAFSESLRERYQKVGWGSRAWAWHEAADTSLFYPRTSAEPLGDLAWLGNFGAEERSRELCEFLVEPSRQLGLRTSVYGVRCPEPLRQMFLDAGVEYRGRVPNYEVPDVLTRFRVAAHVARPSHAGAQAGTPSISLYEALACGIPLVSAPWHDKEGLFTVGRDFLMARDRGDMAQLLSAVLEDRELARALSQSGLETVRARHTCSHRVDELLAICRVLGVRGAGGSKRRDLRYLHTWG